MIDVDLIDLHSVFISVESSIEFVSKLVCPICGQSKPTSRGKNKVLDVFTPRGLISHIKLKHPEYVDQFLKKQILEKLSGNGGKLFMHLWRELGYPDKGRLWRCLHELKEEGYIDIYPARTRLNHVYYTRGTVFRIKDS